MVVKSLLSEVLVRNRKLCVKFFDCSGSVMNTNDLIGKGLKPYNFIPDGFNPLQVTIT